MNVREIKTRYTDILMSLMVTRVEARARTKNTIDLIQWHHKGLALLEEGSEEDSEEAEDWAEAEEEAEDLECLGQSLV